jgi:transcriptional regulator with GAF, ATPase, and Fis domain
MRFELGRAVVAAISSNAPRDVCLMLGGAIVRPTTALARFWLMSTDGSLKLAASGGFATGGGVYNRTDGEFSRIGHGIGKIGQIAATREPLIVRGIRGDEDWLANPGWVSRQGVRAFIGLPLLAGDDVLGVMATFERISPSDDAIEELWFVAAVAAARLQDLATRTAPVERDLRATPSPLPAPRVITRDELRATEKANIEAALAATHGKVFGEDGAARLLRMRPTTLASRIKALEIARKPQETT